MGGSKSRCPDRLSTQMRFRPWSNPGPFISGLIEQMGLHPIPDGAYRRGVLLEPAVALRLNKDVAFRHRQGSPFFHGVDRQRQSALVIGEIGRQDHAQADRGSARRRESGL